MSVAHCFRPLRADDEDAVRAWLAGYLEQHVAWWSAAAGLAIDPREHVDRHGLVQREWLELLAGASAPDAALVEVLHDDPSAAAAGIVHAAVAEDRYLRRPVGRLLWVAVDPRRRGDGLGTALMARAVDWFAARSVIGAEVFVTALNEPAVAAYRRAGFAVVDHRMLAQGPHAQSR